MFFKSWFRLLELESNLRRCLLLVPEFQWRRKHPGKCVTNLLPYVWFLDSEIVKRNWNSFVPGETQEFQIVFQDPAQRQELCIGGSHLWNPASKWLFVVGVGPAGPGACLHLRTSRSWKIEFRPWKCPQKLEKGREGRDKGHNFRRVWPGVMQMIDVWTLWWFCGFWMVTL